MGLVNRFLAGLVLPLRLRRAVLADPEASKLYRRTMLAQVLVTALVGGAIAFALFGFTLWLAQRGGAHFSWDKKGLSFKSGGELSGRVPSTATLLVELGYLLFGSLTFVEGVVIALSREFHDQIGRRAALLTQIPAEDEEAKPRVRLNTKWIRTKLKRKFRGFRVFVAGLPVFAVVAILPSIGSYLYACVTFVWSSYWAVVFAGAKSARAWDDEHTAPEPFFLRVASRLPVIRWFAPAWRKLTKDVFAPCRRAEEHPPELAGLALARVIGTVPILYLFFRPFLPVAAATIIVQSLEAQPAESSQAEPSNLPARS